MNEWSLPVLLKSLHKDIEGKLSIVRDSIIHPGAKGDGSEKVWLDLLNTYLPKRYKAANAFVVDSKGVFSDQIDVVVFDRQYSPFVFHYQDQIIIPAESVYAVFETKQTLNMGMIRYAQDKARSVRKLYRTSLPIPHAGGIYPPKPLIPIMAGILTLESDWKPALGEPLLNQLETEKDIAMLDIGCIASHGYFYHDSENGKYTIKQETKAATAFLFRLISALQFSGTVPMIDIQAYGDWLLDDA
ncbi:MAG: hypothetical protein COA34_001320 [Methylophaga sp.]|jgi:hypothetical protein|uniref:DUF6602 domain-containing protein n=1 Tax=Methylophaga sp. TaxID=2024840 RepID=UPI000C0CBA5F|nr:DUF6602 domain-containing protein [Methylophaga sp.]MBL1456495.1 hypothetical protein [Methylophaga sp.]